MQPNFIAAYLVDTSETEPVYLLLRRAKHSYLPGIWQMVTGKVETGENACFTVQREIKEETGLKQTDLYSVDVTMFYDQSKGRIAYSANFCAYVHKEDPVTLAESEHDAYQWCTLSEATSLLAFPAQKETLAFIHRHFVLEKPDCINRVKVCASV
jgi:8-oxo-dGTP pyrophosphatase MutT (NUDIX family)